MSTAGNEDNADLAGLASGMAHALNNMLSVLFGASDDLLGTPDAAALGRAREAVAHATAGAQSLSAALGLLALTPDDVAMLAREAPYALSPFDMTCVMENLASAADTRSRPSPAGLPEIASRLDRETLQAVLICAAVELRRTHGAQGALDCHMTASPEGGRLELELAHENAQDSAGKSSRVGHHPCCRALERATLILAPCGLAVKRPRAGCIRLVIE